MDNKSDVVKKWFLKADNDLINIENNLASKNIPYDTVYFHSQQAIEKYLKGALVYYEQNVVKTHDLIQLLNQIKLFIPELAEFESEFENIGEFGIQSRYPDLLYEPDVDEAKQSYRVAQEIKAIIKTAIKL